MSMESNSLFPFQPVAVSTRRRDNGDTDGDTTNVSSITLATDLRPRMLVDVDTFSYADATKATSTLHSPEDHGTTTGTLRDLDEGVPSFLYDPSPSATIGSQNTKVNNKSGGYSWPPAEADQSSVLSAVETRVESMRHDEDSMLEYKRQVDSESFVVSRLGQELPAAGPKVVLTSRKGVQVAFGESMPLSDYVCDDSAPPSRTRHQQQPPAETIAFQRPAAESSTGWPNSAPPSDRQQQPTVPTTVKLQRVQFDHRRSWSRAVAIIAATVMFVVIASMMAIAGIFLYCRLSTAQCSWLPNSKAEENQVATIRTFIQNITAPRSPDPIALAWVLQQYGDDESAVPDQWRQKYALVTLGQPLRSVSVCEWPGVVCDDDDTDEVVTQVDLRNHQIAGTLPIDLSLLTDLTLLRLDDNDFSGTIPEEYFAGLASLKVLSLAGNSLSGRVSSAFGNLTELETLDLSSNQLTGELPSSLGTLTQLVTLAVQDNPRVSGSISNSYASLSLQNGYFHGTRLEGSFPLRCHPDRLEIVADCFAVDCTCCTHCCPIARYGIQPYGACGSISRSSFIVDYINDLRRPRAPLQYPFVSSRSATEEERALAWIIESDPLSVLDPLRLRQRYVLAILRPLLSSWLSDAHECRWSGVDCDQETVTQIVLENTTLRSGSIPEDIGMLSDLTRLHLFDSEITGPIPSTMGLLLRLEHLDLSGNLLTGTVPSIIGQLTNLQALGWYANRLTGTLPAEIGSLTQLTVFSTSDNDITGTIPVDLLLCPIDVGYFHNTRLIGNMPFCRGRFLRVLVADCVSVSCPCCTACCTPGGWNGIPEYGEVEGWCS